MPLQNKYIKYSPEITLEIFRQIWERCLSLGLKCWSRGVTYQSEYNQFVYPYNIFRLNGEVLFGTYDTSCELTEISVQEFLGYDPFKKPIEKWVIGSYVVFLTNSLQANGYKIGEICEIKTFDGSSIGTGPYNMLNTVENPAIADQIKWFPTLKEAEEYRDNVLMKPKGSEPIKSEILPKYKIGDKIRLTSVRLEGWNYEGKMDKFLGKDVVITWAGKRGFEFKGDEDWVFNLSDIAGFTSDFEGKPSDCKWSVGDHFVVTKESIGRNGDLNYCYKILKIDFETKLHYEEYNAINTDFVKVRRATEKEILYYNVVKEPYNVMSMSLSITSKETITGIPDIWHIKVNSENREELGKWRTSGTIVGDLYCLSEGHPAGHLSHKGYCMSKAPSNSQEITTEQFRKYVLGKSSEITPPIQLEPVHVETGEFKVGDWVKITKSDQNWDDSMDEYVGMVVQLSSLGASTSKYTFFHIKEDEGHWSWCYEQGHFERVDACTTISSDVSGISTFDARGLIPGSYPINLQLDPSHPVNSKDVWKVPTQASLDALKAFLAEEQFPVLKRMKIELI